MEGAGQLTIGPYGPPRRFVLTSWQGRDHAYAWGRERIAEWLAQQPLAEAKRREVLASIRYEDDDVDPYDFTMTFPVPPVVRLVPPVTVPETEYTVKVMVA